MTTSRQPVLVACCGQEMAEDDAFGLRVAQQLHILRLAGAKVIALGAKPSDLLNYMPGPEAMIVVDAVQDPSKNPGQIINLDWFDPTRPPLVHEKTLSSHGLSIADQIGLAEQLGILPFRVQLVGCTISDARIGQAMTPTVSRQVAIAVGLITGLVEGLVGQYSAATSKP